jgi:hypothetical protein
VRYHPKIIRRLTFLVPDYFILLELFIIIVDFSFFKLPSLLDLVDIFNHLFQVLEVLRSILQLSHLLTLVDIRRFRIKSVSSRDRILRQVLLELGIVSDLLTNGTAA